MSSANKSSLASPTPTVAAKGGQQAQPSIERTAWIVLLLSFTLCMLLTGAVVIGTPQYLTNARVPNSARVQAATVFRAGGSTIRARLCGATQTIAITPEGQLLPECSSIETDPSSKAFITFFDGSTATLSNDTAMVLREMQTPRFAWGTGPNIITIEQSRGSARYGSAPPISRENSPARQLEFTIKTPHLIARLATGSYSIEVDSTGTQISVREGQASVTTLDGTSGQTVGQGSSLTAVQGRPLPTPNSASRNLIRDGDLTDSTLEPAWEIVHDQGGDGGNVDGTVLLQSLGERRAVQIQRTNSENNSAITGIQQQLDKDVSDYRYLSIKADVRLHDQTLPGGGYLSSEYPLIIQLRYRDANGDEFEYLRGFYYQNDANPPNPTKNGDQVPRDVWVPFETGNLLASLKPRPFRVLSVRVYASGWDYTSYVSGLQLIVE
jgi:hypothetical protein